MPQTAGLHRVPVVQKVLDVQGVPVVQKVLGVYLQTSHLGGVLDLFLFLSFPLRSVDIRPFQSCPYRSVGVEWLKCLCEPLSIS